MAHLTTDVMSVLIDPTTAELEANLPPYIVPRILRHLDPETGRAERGEFQCVSIGAVAYNRFTVDVYYRTKRPDGTNGTQFMKFYNSTAAMRCLPVTSDGHVVMIQEHRRQRGAWALMLPAGGEKHGRALDGEYDEICAEFFAARVTYDQVTKRVSVRGKHLVLREPAA